VTLGVAPRQHDLLRSTANFCEGRVPADSIYGILYRECYRLFPDGAFADLFTDVGRRSVPPMITAVVMVLQRLEGCSDREAVDRFAFDARWKYAAGGLDFDYPGFVHTVLVDMRARLAASDNPNRIFDTVLEVAKAAGLVGRKRVLDSTPIYDAVATMDTVTLVRSAIRGVLDAVDAESRVELRAVLTRDDDYASAGKPACDWDDEVARLALVDALTGDGWALLDLLAGQVLGARLRDAAALLATVLGQDIEQAQDGSFRIARRVAKDRVISTVDPETRHGHKSAARGFDGYKGHVGLDPDSEIITATTVTAGNVGDASAAETLIDELLDTDDADTGHADTGHADTGHADTGHADTGHGSGGEDADRGDGQRAACVYGDNAYGTGELHQRLEQAGIESRCKTQQPVAKGGLFAKDRFEVDLQRDTVRCPAGHTTPIRRSSNGAGAASFWPYCTHCPLRQQCTTAPDGRTVSVGIHERQLADARARQRDPDWVSDYRATRPKVERKIAHLMRRRHGGRRARVRGTTKIAADFALLAAAVNLKRLAVLAVASVPGSGWATATR
jgi:hypothetical protein